MDSERQAEATATTATASAPTHAGPGERNAGISATPATSEVIERAKDLAFTCLIGAQYHLARRAHLEWRHKGVMFLVILSGSAIFAQSAELLPDWVTVEFLAAIPTVAGTLDLVCDFSGMARDHAFLQRRYYELAGEIEAFAPNERRLQDWIQRLHSIYGEEPPPMKVLQVLAENAVIDRLYEDELARQKRLKIDRFHSLLANWFAFGSLRVDRVGPT